MKFLSTLLFLAASTITYSQGCSDAGFCTMGAMKPDQPYSKRIKVKLQSAEFSFYRGTTILTPIIYVATADLNFSIKGRNTFQVKLPYQAVDGRLAKTRGMGDISLCFTRNIYNSDKFNLNLSFGAKIPTNHSDKTVKAPTGEPERWPLPMYYQTSLGTYDVISGLSLINRKWLLATGIQVPLNHNNNQFVWSRWAEAESDLKAYADRYNQAKDLRRGIDVMMRVERNFRFSKFNFSVGLLPIYRVKRDEFTKSTTTKKDAPEVRVKPVQAMGMACSALFTAGYNFDVRSGVRVLVGHKLFNRKANPDGLSRELVSSITYIYRF
ncbi:MAG TPA: hypothetical protein VF473_11350 [Cyclobacteriaceae bacterium]